ncbi:MAG TPA: cytochrome c oxidase subunit I [Chthonomonadaceae bacterium]|nr:cytochrome c oxidase subunit I [Chthonomonadaceae bacterium]
MASITARPGELPGEFPEEGHVSYLNWSHTLRSWLLTVDHKRIAVLYLVSITFTFALGAVAIGLVRLELTQPNGLFLENDTYNKMFSMHGILMVFFFLVPSIPATLGNFLLPIMVGARDLAFPRLNLLSWYLYIIGALMAIGAMLFGGVDTGWTFYTPYSSIYSNTNVTVTILAVFLGGFSSIATGINFIVTTHKMRAPGLTWFRLPLFVWAMYATSIIMVLGTPVVAITLSLIVVERVLHIGIFDPALGGDPVLFQHMFWFYSHPAVYIMILPGMGVISELIACFSRKRIFGYSFVAFSSLAIAIIGFFVWGHHLFVTSQSMYAGMVFSILSFLVAIPSAIKVFNWTATIYKGRVWLASPMLYALGFIGLFLIGGLTGLFLATLGTDVHLHDTYFVIAHFHYVMVGGAIMAYLGGVHFWWPKITGRLYPEGWAKLAAGITFIGFNLTFFPQFVVGYLGNPRRYHIYPEEFQVWHILSSAGASVLAVGYTIPLIYLLWSLKYGERSGPNPWGAAGLEWTTDSPPISHNFHEQPVVTWEAYPYNPEVEEFEAQQDREAFQAYLGGIQPAVEEEAALDTQGPHASPAAQPHHAPPTDEDEDL